MKTLMIHYAIDDRAEPVVVEITAAFPLDAENLVPIMRTDSRSLAAALRQALPGGTFDRLLIELLQYQAGELIRSYAHWDQPTEVAP